MKHFFVINPILFEASVQLPEIIKAIEDCFPTTSTEYKIHITLFPREAIAAVHHYILSCPKDEIVRIYAVGGAGLFFECLNGMVDFPNAELTCVSYGVASEFALTFGQVNAKKFQDIKSLLTAPSRPMDIIRCGTNYVLLGLTVGLVGQTVIMTKKVFPRLPQKWLKKNSGLAYSICALITMFNKQIMTQKYKITVDGRDFSGAYCNIFISNIATKGGGLVPTPYAKPNDGIVDVLFVDAISKFTVMKTINNVNKGHYAKYPNYHYHTFKTMEIESDDLLSVEMDGEAFYARELKLEVIPGGVKVFAPEGLDFADYSHRAWKCEESQNNASA